MHRIRTIIGAMAFTVFLTLAIGNMGPGGSFHAAIGFATVAGLFLGLTLVDLRHSDR